jgi:hypothetical protein
MESQFSKLRLVAADAPLPIDRKKAQAFASVDILASPDQVWELIGGFGSLPDWLPYISQSELSRGGRVRHLANRKGETIVERLEAFDNRARSYTYSILKASSPVTGYLSTLRVLETEGGKGSRVEWSARFTPKGVSNQEASRIYQDIFEDGLKALAAGFASKKKKKEKVRIVRSRC